VQEIGVFESWHKSQKVFEEVFVRGPGRRQWLFKITQDSVGGDASKKNKRKATTLEENGRTPKEKKQSFFPAQWRGGGGRGRVVGKERPGRGKEKTRGNME